MNVPTNTNSENKLSSSRSKSSFRRDGSYRIFHITKKQKEESDEDENNFYIKNQQINDKGNDIKSKYQKKSFKRSSRYGLDGLKRKSNKNKRLLFLHKTSCELTSIEGKTPPSSSFLTSDLSQSNICNDAAEKRLLKKNKRHNEQEADTKSSESEALVEAVDQTIAHDDATLNDLLARADKLETTIKTQEFNKVRPIARSSFHHRRKRSIVACGTVLVALIVIISIITFIVVMTIRYKSQTNQIPKSPSIHEPHR